MSEVTDKKNTSFSPSEWQEILRNVGYIIDDERADEIACWWQEPEPLLLEGPPGTGKTDLAKKICQAIKSPFYRIQCYDGINSKTALYYFNERLQDLEIEKAEKNNALPENLAEIVFSDRCMVRGKIAQSFLDTSDDIIVLIDEFDKARDGQLEAAMLEFFDEGAITIQETLRRLTPVTGKKPHIIVTSNAGLDQSGIKSGGKSTLSYPIIRRCKYIYLDEPTVQRQAEILRDKVPELSNELSLKCALFVNKMNKLQEMEKAIALSETIAWARSLVILQAEDLNEKIIFRTKGDLAKSGRDIKRLIGNTPQVLTSIQETLKRVN